MKKTLRNILIWIMIIIWVVPLVWLLVTSLKVEQDVVTDKLTIFTKMPTLANYRKAFETTPIGQWLLNSLIVSAASTVLTLAVDSTMAYALSRIRFRGRKALFIFVLAGMMVPFEALIIQLYLEFNALGLLDTLWAIILPRLALPIGVFILVQFFNGIPDALEEAAYIDGASRFTVFKDIILPLGKSAMVAVAIISFISAWNDFLWPLIVVSESSRYTVTVGIANFQGTTGTEYSLIMAGAMIASLPQIIMYMFFRKDIVQGIAMTGIKG